MLLRKKEAYFLIFDQLLGSCSQIFKEKYDFELQYEIF
jgi:hypothetical protein